jgi:predicted aspartyl protease
MFFFEKKNQKTFANGVGVWLRCLSLIPAASCTSLLVLFFKKEHPFFLGALLMPVTALASCPTRQEAVLPLTQWQDKLLLPISINGSPQMIALDTGAGISAISTKVADAIDLPHDFDHAASLGGVGGRESTLFIGQVDRIDLDAVKLTHLSLPIIDFPMKTASSQPVAGLLGADILRHFDVEIDIPAGRLTLWKQAECADPQPPWTTSGEAVPFTLDEGGHIIIPFKLDGLTVNGVLDTGAAGFAVTLPAALRSGVTEDDLARDIPIHGTGVNNRGWTGYLHQFNSVRFAGAAFHDIRAELVPSNFAGHNDALIGADALLGMPLLRNMRIWISYKNNLLFMQ